MLFSTLGAAFGASGSPSSSKSASPGLRKINKLNPDSLLWAPWFATVCPPRSHHEGKSSHRGGAGGDSQQGVFDNLQLRAITAELIKQTISLLRKNNVAQQLSGQTIVAFDIPPTLLATNRVIAFNRLDWPNQDAAIRAGS